MVMCPFATTVEHQPGTGVLLRLEASPTTNAGSVETLTAMCPMPKPRADTFTLADRTDYRPTSSVHCTHVIPVWRRPRSRGKIAARRSSRGRVKHGQGPVHVEPFTKPVGGCRVPVDRDAGGCQMGTGGPKCRSSPTGGRRCLKKRPAIRPEEASLSVIPQLDSESPFVHRSVMMSAHEKKIVEPRRATVRTLVRIRLPALGGVLMSRSASARREERADRESVSDEQRRQAGRIGGQTGNFILTRVLSPVSHVVCVAMGRVAAGEAAAAVPGRERPPDGGWNRKGLAPDVEYGSVSGVGHDHTGGIAREAPRRLRGNADAVFEH